MSVPLRNLPVMQNWDCRTCGDCCRTLEGVITDEEKRRIEALIPPGDPDFAPGPWFVPRGRNSGKWTLTHRPSGGCVFLTDENHCRIQERFGAEAKPFVCRLFPFILVPAGDHWRVGIRYSCPSAAANFGRPVVDAEEDLVGLSRLLEAHTGRSADSAPPPSLQEGQTLSWPDVCRVVQVLVEIVEDRRDPLERRLRKCLAMVRIGGRTEWNNLGGHKVTKFLQAVRNAMDAEVPREPADLPPPDRLLGRIPFRTVLAIYARKDPDAYGGLRIPKRLGRVVAGWRFLRGRGRVPRVNPFLPDVRFQEIEREGGKLPELEETLERYYAVKLNSLQFCGPPNFDMSLWDGLESLFLTLPMILWLRRAFRDQPPVEALERAIQIVDNHFGGDPMLGFPHVRYLVRLMAERGEIEKLVAWYSR
ncbi:YkgJ family cysteine cluster protein [Aquisphaera insulae]|uniref:YkgJ family cysteine cluster protein n=1 Tax=Aquisphaera insulae TaxID=2712864 RepID=UPI0013ED8762|nr:YkgJ family cysteine cluster protein [Aquisphaera insulae]